MKIALAATTVTGVFASPVHIIILLIAIVFFVFGAIYSFSSKPVPPPLGMIALGLIFFAANFLFL